MAEHNDLGTKGEQMAAAYLQKKGYEILATNYRYEKAEVDIIAQKGNLLVVAEVKTRRGTYFGQPEEAVSEAKQNLLSLAAGQYMEEHDLDMEVRFDIISISYKNERPVIRHFEDAFFPVDNEP